MRRLTDFIPGKRKKKEKNTEASQAAPSVPNRAPQARKRDSVVVGTYADAIEAIGRPLVVSAPSSSTLRPVRGEGGPTLDKDFLAKFNSVLNNLTKEAREKLAPKTEKAAGPALSTKEAALMEAQGAQASSRRQHVPTSRLAHPDALAVREQQGMRTEAPRPVTPPGHANAGPYRHGGASQSAPNVSKTVRPLPPLPNRSKSGDEQKPGVEVPSFFRNQQKLREQRRIQQENNPPAQPPMSEKARGKQRAIDPPSRSPSLSSTKSRGSDRSGPSL